MLNLFLAYLASGLTLAVALDSGKFQAFMEEVKAKRINGASRADILKEMGVPEYLLNDYTELAVSCLVGLVFLAYSPFFLILCVIGLG